MYTYKHTCTCTCTLFVITKDTQSVHVRVFDTF